MKTYNLNINVLVDADNLDEAKARALDYLHAVDDVKDNELTEAEDNRLDVLVHGAQTSTQATTK